MRKGASRVEFTRRMKADYTVLIPNMIPIHFEMMKNMLLEYGYKAVLLDNEGPAVIELGLKYVHNDTCYPALLVIGQLLDALRSGAYDPEKTALMITQTGGGCRASNYIHLLRKALGKAGLSHVPVISFNLSGMEKNSGFRLTLPMLRKALAAMAYGDLLMLLDNQTMPYEVRAGDSHRLVTRWIARLGGLFSHRKGYSLADMERCLGAIADSFARIPVAKTERTRVGIVGEIYVKYAGLANNHLDRFLVGQGCEVMAPGILGFLIFKVDNRLEDIRLYGGSAAKARVIRMLMGYLRRVERAVILAAERHDRFIAPSSYRHLKDLVKGVVGYGNKMGEGWFLTAEMIELVENGFSNIVCTQPFGCLPNHIVGKGMIRKIRSIHPNANIVPVDYDPGATRVNQENRIKLMLAMARDGRGVAG